MFPQTYIHTNNRHTYLSFSSDVCFPTHTYITSYTRLIPMRQRAWDLHPFIQTYFNAPSMVTGPHRHTRTHAYIHTYIHTCLGGGRSRRGACFIVWDSPRSCIRASRVFRYVCFPRHTYLLFSRYFFSRHTYLWHTYIPLVSRNVCFLRHTYIPLTYIHTFSFWVCMFPQTYIPKILDHTYIHT